MAKDRANERLEQGKTKPHGGGVREGERKGAPHGMDLDVEQAYTWAHADPRAMGEHSGEPEHVIKHNPFYISPGMAVGYSPGLYGKGLADAKPRPNGFEGVGGKQWGDPDDEQDWYCQKTGEK